MNHPEPERGDLPEPAAESGAGAPVRRWGVIRALEVARRGIDRGLAAVCVAAFVLLVAIVTWQVFTRQVLQDSAPWTEEAARYTFVVLALLGSALVFSERGHIAVEIVVTRLPARLQKVVAVLVELTVAFFALFVFVYGGIRVAENAWAQDISTLPLTVGQVYLVLPIAGVLIAFYSLFHLLEVLADVEPPFPPVDDTAEAV